MGQNNKINGRMAFAAIIGKEGDVPSYEEFLNIDTELGIKETRELTQAKALYRQFLNEAKGNIEILSHLEELISQIRSKEMIPSEMKLSTCTSYVYARSTFYRRRYAPNEIRVFIGRTDIVGNDLDTLRTSEPFMTLAKRELSSVMNKEIKQTQILINQLTK
jgi:hypothetical protein